MSGWPTALLLFVLTAGAVCAEDPSGAALDVETLQARWLAAPGDTALGLRLQDALLAAGLRTRAESLFRRTASEHEDDAALLFLAGRARGDARGLEMMREAWTLDLGHAPETRSGLLGVSIAMAVAEVEAGDGPRAAAAAERVVALRGGADDLVYLAWIRHRMLRRAELARESYAAALRKQADHLGARSGLLGLLLEAGETSAALESAREGVRLRARSSKAHRNLAQALLAAGEHESAVASCTTAQRLALGDADALAATASLWVDLGRGEEARSVYEQALALEPRHGGALTGAGILAMDRGDLRAARRLLTAAGRARPRSARVAFLQGVCAQRMGLLSSAISSFRRATDLEPGRVEYVAALGMAHLEKGSLASAVMMLERAVEMAPEDAGLRLQLGIAHYKGRRWRPAEEAFEQAAAGAPRDPRPHFYLALIHGDKQARPREALADLERYAALGGKDAAALAWKVRLQRELGDR